MKVNSILCSIATVALFSCNTAAVDPLKPYADGVIVVNAGNFTDNNGTISLMQRTGQTVNTDLFQKENQRSIAGGISGYAEANGMGIILVDNATAGKDAIEIVNAETFKVVASIPSSDIENPRNVIKISDNKVYISAWDATGDWSNFYKNPGYVAVLDMNTYKITKKIKVQNGAETLLLVGNDVYVGSTGSEKTELTVIDTKTDAVSASIAVGVNPAIIGLDASKKLWIYAGEELKKINTTTKAIESKMKIVSANAEKSPSNFAMSSDKNTIYFKHSFYDAADGYKEKGETYSFKTNATAITAEIPLIKKSFSGMAVDPKTGNIYAGLTPSYKQAGYVFRYQKDGVLIDSVKAEIAPSKFFFKN